MQGEDDLSAFNCRLQGLLWECWQGTGFGELVIESERVRGNGHKIAVTLRGSTSYRFVISEVAVQEM